MKFVKHQFAIGVLDFYKRTWIFSYLQGQNYGQRGIPNPVGGHNFPQQEQLDQFIGTDFIPWAGTRKRLKEVARKGFLRKPLISVWPGGKGQQGFGQNKEAPNLGKQAPCVFRTNKQGARG